jgi:hypothetical protein
MGRDGSSMAVEAPPILPPRTGLHCASLAPNAVEGSGVDECTGSEQGTESGTAFTRHLTMTFYSSSPCASCISRSLAATDYN